MTSYGSRNQFYLRLNPQTILPVFLHLDEAAGHTEWMNDGVLQQVINDLRSLIGNKISAEDSASAGPTSAKKTSGVDVHRGASYQFGYYLQKADYHNVLIKTRNYVTATVPRAPSPPPAQKRISKRGKKRRRSPSEEEIELSDRESDEEAPQRGASRSHREGEEQPLFLDDDEEDDVVVKTEEDAAPFTISSAPIDVDAEDEEKTKLKLELRYDGFSITGYRLCLIVQPYPPLPPKPSAERAASLLPSRQASIAPFLRGATPVLDKRAATPLFREPTPLFRESTPLFREPTPFDEPMAMDEEEPVTEDYSLDGLKNSTQSMSTSGHGIGGGDDDVDGDDSGVLFGDADD